ncbi:MAG: fibronectin type III domain-containing protein [Clostridia bacterium]|nr:fibronectin type III domain-containing protein [Clostridia bacterium]
MKKILNNKIGISLAVVFTVLVCFVTATFSFAAEDEFEKKIAAFPESYKPYLRQLHIAHPSWEFEPFFTNLDFNASVDSELGAKSLVDTVGSEIFKSKDIGDYDYSSNKYIQKDGGFVEANRLAVAYFMDPRNFLNEDGIFMFETLSFSDSFTVEAVENVLKGSFMANKKISYYNSEGELKKTSTKYSKAIFNAGKKYNVNPCYLASKILNEVGTAGSKSVTGTHSTYPGIYNFYNIGAYDGANAIAKGLKWASEKGTYGRPWTTPVKSINGGAEFLASSYIAQGQFTGYLQRFNVNPNGYYKPYDHQYMTNLTGALSQGYSTYVSYVRSGLIDNKYVFSVPVYENMPSWTSAEGKGKLSDSAGGQSGNISADACVVRTGPSTNYSKRTTASGSEIKLTKGAAISITDKVNTDSKYYLDVLKYPYWYKIRFVLNGYTYEGYVPATFVDITSTVQVVIGEYSPSFVTSDSEVEMHLISYDARIAQITADNKINFLENGTVLIGAYDSLGNFDRVKYTVKDDVSISAVRKNADGTATVFWSAVEQLEVAFNAISNIGGYEVYKYDELNNTYVKVATLPPTAYSYTVPAAEATAGKYAVRAFGTVQGETVYGNYSATADMKNIPQPVTGLALTNVKSSTYTLTWNAVPGAKYNLYKKTNGAYSLFKTFIKTKYKPTKQANSSFSEFKLVSVKTVNGIAYESLPTSDFSVTTLPSAVKNFKISSSDVGGKVTWSAVPNATGYDLYVYKDKKKAFAKLKTVTTNSYNLKGRTPGKEYTLQIIPRIRTTFGVFKGEATDLTFRTKPGKVTEINASSVKTGSMKLTWNETKATSCYYVYRYSTKKKKYVKIATVNSETYTVSGLSAGTTYKYKIKSVKLVNGKAVCTNTSAAVSFTTRPEKVTEVKTSARKKTYLTLSWEKVTGAEKYQVFMYSKEKKKYVRITTVSGKNKYKVKGLKAGTTYKFRIKAVKSFNGKNYFSENSAVFSFTTKK